MSLHREKVETNLEMAMFGGGANLLTKYQFCYFSLSDESLKQFVRARMDIFYSPKRSFFSFCDCFHLSEMSLVITSI